MSYDYDLAEETYQALNALARANGAAVTPAENLFGLIVRRLVRLEQMAGLITTGGTPPTLAPVTAVDVLSEMVERIGNLKDFDARNESDKGYQMGIQTAQAFIEMRLRQVRSLTPGEG